MRMLSSLGRIDQTKVRTGKLMTSWPRLTSAFSLLNEKPCISRHSCTHADRLRSRAALRQHPEGLGIVMVDYLQLMQVSGGGNRANRFRRSLVVEHGES